MRVVVSVESFEWGDVKIAREVDDAQSFTDHIKDLDTLIEEASGAARRSYNPPAF